MIRDFLYATALLAAAAPAAGQMMQYGIICQTQWGWCRLANPAPLGSQCYCMTPQGPVYGMVR